MLLIWKTNSQVENTTSAHSVAQGKQLLGDSISVADSAEHQNLDSLGSDSLATDSRESRRLESASKDTDLPPPDSDSTEEPGWRAWNDLSDSTEPDPAD